MNELADELASTDEVIIEHPLRFPWDSLPSPKTFAPITVQLTDESLLDLAALEPVFSRFLDGDRIEAPDSRLAQYLAHRYDLGTYETLAARTTAKHIARNRHAVLARLEREAADRGDRYLYGIDAAGTCDAPTTVVVEVGPFPIDAEGFEGLVRANAPTLSPASLIEAWGLRAAPGAPTVGAVLAFRIEPDTP